MIPISDALISASSSVISMSDSTISMIKSVSMSGGVIQMVYRLFSTFNSMLWMFNSAMSVLDSKIYQCMIM